jgi:DNA-binding transcriptional MerR regulator
MRLTPYPGTAANFSLMAGMTIGRFAAAEGVSVETIRFYQRKGLLPLPERRGSGFRKYTEADQWRLAFIRRARLLGFPLTEIGDLLGPVEADLSHGEIASSPRWMSAEEITLAAEAKLAAVTAQIAELGALACRLRRLAQVCAHGSRDDCVALNTDENPESMRAYGVKAVPAISVFSGGEVVKQVIGAKSKSALLREFAEFI